MVSMVFNYLWLPLAVLGQEITESPTETPVPTETPLPTEEPTPTPTEVPQETPTETPQPEADPPVAETATPTETPEETPTATIEPTSTETPQETPTPDLEVVLTSLLTPTLTPTPTEIGSTVLTDAAALAPVEEVVIVIPKELVTNVVTINNNDQAVANAGSNTASGGGQTGIISGDAVAIANVINMVETSIVNSQIGVFLYDDPLATEGEKSDLDLNELWKMTTYDSSQMSLINWLSWLGINQILIGNDVSVLANSGLNFIGETKDAFIMTGDATALANILNVIGLSADSSKMFFGIVNINGSNLANIILPRPELFFGTSGENNLGNSAAINMVSIDSSVVASANSGGNTIDANTGTLVTGDVLAIANTTNLVNLNTTTGGFYFSLNTTGNLDGVVQNWLSPGGVMSLNPIVNLFFLGLNSQAIGGEALGANLVGINNNVTALANTGGNTIDSRWANMMTGDASSIVNISNLVNLNLINSNWFYGLVNIIGDWKGNIIFAYPDLEIQMSAVVAEVGNGDQFGFRIGYFNKGYEESQNTVVEMKLPDEFRYMGDNSGFVVSVKGNNISWQVGTVGAFEEGGFDVLVEANAYGETANNLVKSAWAAMNLEVNTESAIETSQTETNVNNNYSSVKTKINLVENGVGGDGDGEENKQDYENGSDGVDQRQPILTIESKNNVGEFVNPTDIVSFEVKVENNSDVPAYDTFLVNEIYDTNDELVSYNEIYIGEIKAYKTGTIRFGLPVPSDFEGEYENLITIYGYATNDNFINSNTSQTEFSVKGRNYGVGIDTGEVLAEIDEIENGNNLVLERKDLLAYALLVLVSSGWVYKQINIWKENKEGKLKIFDVLLFLVAIGSFGYSLVSIFAN